jgi:hypothetical protein
MRRIQLKNMYSFHYPEQLDMVKEKFGNDVIIILTEEYSRPNCVLAYAESSHQPLYSLYPSKSYNSPPVILCDYHGPTIVDTEFGVSFYPCPLCK